MERDCTVFAYEYPFVVRVVSVNLDGNPYNWVFSRGEHVDRDEFTATVYDRDFLNKVRAGEIAFTSGDELSVVLRVERRAFNTEEGVEFKHFFSVEKVIENGKRDSQGKEASE